MNPAEKIAAVIDAHTPTGAEGIVDCYCGPRFNTFREHAQHVAAEVVKALGLTEEWAFVTEEDVIDGALFPDESEISDDRRWVEERIAERCTSCDRCRNAQSKQLINRHVTGWSVTKEG